MLKELAVFIQELLLVIGNWAPLLSCFLIIIESMLPVLPLCTFITINFISFGSIIGFIISWLFTCIGCLLSYFLVKKGIRNWYETRIYNANLFDKALEYVKKLSFPSLTMILAMPFTPAFMINIAAGMANIEFKKFLFSIIIGKLFMVYFWGYIGVGLIESFNDPLILIKIVIMLILAYTISSIVKNKIEKSLN